MNEAKVCYENSEDSSLFLSVGNPLMAPLASGEGRSSGPQDLTANPLATISGPAQLSRSSSKPAPAASKTSFAAAFDDDDDEEEELNEEEVVAAEPPPVVAAPVAVPKKIIQNKKVVAGAH
jgi:hypothetical protein